MFLTHLLLPRVKESAAVFSQLMANNYLEHQVLWDMLKAAPDATRDFLFRSDVTDQGLEIYVLGPEAFAPGFPWIARSRPYQPTISEGQLLGFSLRVSPTEDKAQGKDQRSRRQDMVMARYIEAQGQATVEQVSQAVAKDWLSRREESSGFRVVEADASGYRRVEPFKRGKSMGKVPLLDIKGLLEVTDPELFMQRQHRGFGKSKFVGSGLMLLSAPR